MKILVYNRDIAEKIFDNSYIPYEEKDSFFVISITDPHQKLAKLKVSESHILRLQFYDIDRPLKDLSGEEFLPMSVEDANKVVKFIKYNLKNIGTLIVHCEAGISRSAGVAAAISKYIDNTDEYFFRVFLPNKWCYNKVLEALNNDN